MMFGMGGSMFIFWVLIVVVIVLLFWELPSWGVREASESSNYYSPLEILKRRYARGEIDREEFEVRQKDLL